VRTTCGYEAEPFGRELGKLAIDKVEAREHTYSCSYM
jgi:hypothetical protein